MAESPIQTGILSYGMSGRVFHAPFIEANEHFLLSAIVERSKNEAQLKYPHVTRYTSVDDLLADESIELVIVNTPNDTHVDFAKKALLAGKHVLIEKPFAPTVEEANELFELGAKVGKQVMAYHNRRFDSDFISLKKVLESGEIGEPIELHLRFDRYKMDVGPKVFKETKRPASGILYDLGSHLLDQTISLFGKPYSVTKIKSTHRPQSKVDDYACLILNYKKGLNVFITTSLLVADPQASFVLHATKGSFIKNRTDVQERQLLLDITPDNAIYGVEDAGSSGLLTIVHKPGENEQLPISSDKGNYMQVFEEVYEAIRNRKPYYVQPEQIITQLEILSDPKK
ncbi:Gfo/Idh/MocA family oxidoreductase [Sphingobacterium hungaricum]